MFRACFLAKARNFKWHDLQQQQQEQLEAQQSKGLAFAKAHICREMEFCKLFSAFGVEFPQFHATHSTTHEAGSIYILPSVIYIPGNIYINATQKGIKIVQEIDLWTRAK